MPEVDHVSVLETIQLTWHRFPISTEALMAYGRDLEDIPAEQLIAAVRVIAAEGARDAPTSGQIRLRHAELQVAAPSWTDARAALLMWRSASVNGAPEREAQIAEWQCPHKRCDGSAFVWIDDASVTDCSCRPAFLAVSTGRSVLPQILRDFVDLRHVTTAELDVLLGAGDTTLDAQLRDRWKAFVKRSVDAIAYAGISAVGLPGLELAEDDLEVRISRTSSPRRMDAMAHLLGPGA